jgi:hypothetical protein
MFHSAKWRAGVKMLPALPFELIDYILFFLTPREIATLYLAGLEEPLPQIILHFWPSLGDRGFRAAVKMGIGELTVRSAPSSLEIINRLFRWACGDGRLEILEILAAMGTNDWNGGMARAAKAGRFDLVQYIEEKGGNGYERAMISAAGGGHLELVEYLTARMLERRRSRAFSCQSPPREEELGFWREAADRTINAASRLLIRLFLLDMDAWVDTTEWDLAMAAAAKGGHWNLVRHFEQKGANWWDKAMVSAARGGHWDLVRHFEEKALLSRQH